MFAAGCLALTGAVAAAAPGVAASPPDNRDRPDRTPVFSARRVPVLIQSLVARPELVRRLDSVLAASPPGTCLDVQVDGLSLYGADVTRSLIPASNQKIVTAQLALDVLGSDHRFRTDVNGDLGRDGTVNGNLYLVGGGDPVLRTKAYTAYLGAAAGQGTSLEKLADAVVARGVRRVTGSVVGDESRYDSDRSVPGWPTRYLDQHQLGPLSALEVNQGFTSFPATYDEDALGSLRATTDPPVFAAQTFAELLEQRGVRIDGPPVAGVHPAGSRLVASVSSPPLTAIVAQLLNRSDNQIAELLVKEAGRTHGTGGTTAAGLAVFHRAFQRLGVPTQGVRMVDGSGLSYDNRLNCAVLVALLNRSGANSSIGSGLAVGGRTGTLRERFRDPSTKGRIQAKTGTLDDVSALSGFAHPGAAPALVFSYIENGAPVTETTLETQERLGRALVGYGDTVPLTRLGRR